MILYKKENIIIKRKLWMINTKDKLLIISLLAEIIIIHLKELDRNLNQEKKYFKNLKKISKY
jgi:hypothetical protein